MLHRKRDTQSLIALLNSFAELSTVFRTLINAELNAVAFRRSLSLVSHIFVRSMVTEYVRTRSLRKVGVGSICFVVFSILWFKIHSHRPSELLLDPSRGKIGLETVFHSMTDFESDTVTLQSVATQSGYSQQ